jgi:hypothetical protein
MKFSFIQLKNKVMHRKLTGAMVITFIMFFGFIFLNQNCRIINLMAQSIKGRQILLRNLVFHPPCVKEE